MDFAIRRLTRGVIESLGQRVRWKQFRPARFELSPYKLFPFIRRRRRQTPQRDLTRFIDFYLRKDCPDARNHPGNNTEVRRSKARQQHGRSEERRVGKECRSRW